MEKVLRKSIWCIALVSMALSACEDDEKPQSPPEIGDAKITCKDPRRVGEYPEFGEIAIAITDAERDLVPSTIKGTINGIVMTGFVDPDADERYSWSPAVETEPPMICKGEFTLIVEASDLGGRTSTKTITVSP